MIPDIRKHLRRNRSDTVYICKKSAVQTGGMGAIIAAPGAEVPLPCDIQPGAGSLLLEEYGERAKDMLAVFADPEADVSPGDMVRVYAAGKPDYRVVAAPMRKNYRRIDLERL